MIFPNVRVRIMTITYVKNIYMIPAFEKSTTHQYIANDSLVKSVYPPHFSNQGSLYLAYLCTKGGLRYLLSMCASTWASLCRARATISAPVASSGICSLDGRQPLTCIEAVATRSSSAST